MLVVVVVVGSPISDCAESIRLLTVALSNDDRRLDWGWDISAPSLPVGLLGDGLSALPSPFDGSSLGPYRLDNVRLKFCEFVAFAEAGKLWLREATLALRYLGSDELFSSMGWGVMMGMPLSFKNSLMPFT